MKYLSSLFLVALVFANSLYAQENAESSKAADSHPVKVDLNGSNSCTNVITEATEIDELHPITIECNVKGSLIKKVTIDVTIKQEYANFGISANDHLLLDYVGIPTSGNHQLSGLIKFPSTGTQELKLLSKNGAVTINHLDIKDCTELEVPSFTDISEKAGLEQVNSSKYGGPCIADIDQDGDYDFIVINHNAETNKLYWNNGDGTLTKHDQDISRWYMEDLHGASCADFDNDGDLDIMQTKGGGNGKNPSLPDFWRNDNGKLVLVTGDVGFTAGARGRGARWSDLDLDGDLDVMFINAKGIAGETPQHLFYRNKGDATFELVSVEGIELADAQRCVVTDINGDNIDDFILYDPTTTIWLGNGDFTFTDATSQLPEEMQHEKRFMGATDIDIDNDGDFDLYFARGNGFGVGNKPSFDFCPVHMRMDIKIRNSGSFELALEAEDDIDFHDYDFTGRNGFKGDKYPVYLGKKKASNFFNRGGKMMITQDMAKGWPKDISGNGIYFGYMGKGKWKSAVVINGDIFWNVAFSLSGVKNATPEFIALNRNVPDILLRNDGGKFVNVSKEWNIPGSGNHSGVSVGDINNDGFSDLFLHRYGFLSSKPADFMLVNTGKGTFETITPSDLSNPEDEGHGDMGQIFDFDLDGDLDMLNGSEEDGAWYLYENELITGGVVKESNNYALVKVGYSPESNVDAISAEVIVTTPQHVYRRRVGSSGEVFSQSLMNIVHFGLGEETEIEKITVRWRNGEVAHIANKKANQIFDTDKVDPVDFKLDQAVAKVRVGTSIKLSTVITPINASNDVEWSSSNDAILTVADGVVTAVGKKGQKAVITATSKVTGVSASAKVSIVKWYAMPVQTVEVTATQSEMYEGRELSLSALVMPKYTDNSELTWESSDVKIATVSQTGVVTSVAAGEVSISAISKADAKVKGEVNLKVLPYIAPVITIADSTMHYNTKYIIGETIDITVNYHAGSGNKVAAQDLGGVKIMLRELDHRMAFQNVMFLDKEALGTQSGTVSTTLSLEGLKPTSKLAEGHAYYIIAYMASSNGELYTHTLTPLTIEIE